MGVPDVAVAARERRGSSTLPSMLVLTFAEPAGYAARNSGASLRFQPFKPTRASTSSASSR